MIFFFDRSIGTAIPKALREYLKPPGIEIEYHQIYFAQNEKDDIWLPQVGSRDWFVIGQDYAYHEKPAELAAIKAHNIGAFYLWGAEQPKWETMRVFAKAYDKITEAADDTDRPFVYRVHRSGALVEVLIP